MSERSMIKLNNGSLMPQLGLGVWQASVNQAQVAVEYALETGYRLIDTAAIYQNEQGVGQAIAQSSLPREQLFITTKLWNSDQLTARQALESSLKKLQLDYIDLYLIHWPCPTQDHYLQAWRSLITLQQEGLIKQIGVCNFQQEHLKRLIADTAITPVINQIELHPLLQQRPLHAWNALHHIQTQSWSPLAQGGKGVFEHEVVKALAQRYEKTPAQIVIRWHLDSGLVVIPKSVTQQRIAENFDVFDFKMDKDDLTAIGSMDADKRLGPDPDYMDRI